MFVKVFVSGDNGPLDIDISNMIGDKLYTCLHILSHTLFLKYVHMIIRTCMLQR